MTYYYYYGDDGGDDDDMFVCRLKEVACTESLHCFVLFNQIQLFFVLELADGVGARRRVIISTATPSPSQIGLVVSVDVQHHVYLLTDQNRTALEKCTHLYDGT